MVKVYTKGISPNKPILEWFIEWEPELVHPIMRCHLMNICPSGQFQFHSWTKFSFKPVGDPKKAISLETLRGKAEMVYGLYFTEKWHLDNKWRMVYEIQPTKTWSCACGKCKGIKFKDMVCDKCFEPVRFGVL